MIENGFSLTFKLINSSSFWSDSVFNVTKAPGYWCALPNSAKLRSELVRLAWCTSAAMTFFPFTNQSPFASNVAYAFSFTIVLLAKVVWRAARERLLSRYTSLPFK